MDDLIPSQVHDISLFDEVDIQAGVTHDDFGIITRGNGRFQLGPEVGSLRVGQVFKFDGHFGMRLLEKLLDLLHAFGLIAFHHVMEHRDFDHVTFRQRGGNHSGAQDQDQNQ